MLFLEEKASKQYLADQDYLFSTNNFVLSDAKCKASGPLNRGDIADITFVDNIISNSNQVSGKRYILLFY